MNINDETATHAPSVANRRCGTILVVEDDDAIRETLVEALRYEGYSVISAGNGHEALSQLRTIRHPCLILLDLMMPVMNGWEFVRELRRDDALATIPVLVVTAFGEQARSFPAEAILKKPVDLDRLLDFVKRYCA